MNDNEQLVYTAAAGFEAARQLSSLPAAHPSRQLHGHSFVVNIRAARAEQWSAFPGDEVDELQRRLAHVTAHLDYRNLNATLDQPTDENLARWIRHQLSLSELNHIGVQSTLDRGVDVDANDHAHIWRRYVFQAAHKLPHVPAEHKCGRMHGHGFEVLLHADQDLSASDDSIDYDSLDRVWIPLHEQLHLVCLNDIHGLENPTSELISSWIWHRIKPQFPALSWVTVYETASCGAYFDGNRYHIWKDMTLDSAVRLMRAPPGDPRRRIHGHTYTLRLHLCSGLDALMGWTLDFGDVKAKFHPIFRQLDHEPLYEAIDAADNDVATLARWIQAKAASVLPELNRVDLFATRGGGAILTWGQAPAASPI